MPTPFSARFPSLFHMAEAGSWPAIRRHGLLSTAAILDGAGVTGEARRLLLSGRRPESVAVDVGDDTFVLCDQKPLSVAKLETCLVDVTVAEWLAILNGKVFLWPTRRRCEELSRARAYRGRSHLVLELDTESLLSRHGERVWFAAINTGATLYNPRPRGRATFRPVTEWRPGDRVAEVAVDNAIPEITEVVKARFRVESGEWTAL